MRTKKTAPVRPPLPQKSIDLILKAIAEQDLDTLVAEQRTRVQRDSLLWEMTAGMEVCKRAIAVAAYGGHSVLFIGHSAALAQALAQAADVRCIALPDCQRAMTEELRNAMRITDIHCEAPQRQARHVVPNPGRLSDSMAQCGIHPDVAKCQVPCSLEDGARRLLRTAVSEIGAAWSEERVATIQRVAATISRMSSARGVVGYSDVVEAIMYAMDRR